VTTTRTLREHLGDGPFSLALSAGYFGFYAHLGFSTALRDAGFVPGRYAGASAGALVAATLACDVDPTTTRRELDALRREHFWDPGVGLGLLRGGLFLERLRGFFGARAIEDAAAPLAISVHDVLAWRTRAADRGDVALHVRASCALPGLFHPAWIDGRPFVDGGVQDWAGLFGVASSPRVLHHVLGRARPRAGILAVVVDGLPRVSPFALANGPRAYDHAARALRTALARPVVDGVVRA
jgi:NTE family protein